MNISTEFPDYDPATLPPIPADWTDCSWHNDACPSFATPSGHYVFVDYASAEMREYPDCPRFSVRAENIEADLYSGDDWADVLRIVKKA